MTPFSTFWASWGTTSRACSIPANAAFISCVVPLNVHVSVLAALAALEKALYMSCGKRKSTVSKLVDPFVRVLGESV